MALDDGVGISRLTHIFPAFVVSFLIFVGDLHLSLFFFIILQYFILEVFVPNVQFLFCILHCFRLLDETLCT